VALVLHMWAGGDSWNYDVQQTQTRGKQKAGKKDKTVKKNNKKEGKHNPDDATGVEFESSNIVQQQQQQQQQQQSLPLTVGMSGPAVTRAKETSVAPPIKTKPRVEWNELATKTCLAQGFPAEVRPENLIDLKLPFGIVLGDTTTLYNYLNQHPDITPIKPDLNFLDVKVDAWVLKSRQGIPRKDARVGYAKAMNRAILNPSDKEAVPSRSRMLIDWTPTYLFHCDKVPARVHCIVPWVHMIGLLQNPTDRALAQYERTEFHVEGSTPPSFEDYILADIAALQETGVLQDWNEVKFDEFSGSAQERMAWRTYVNSGLPSPVGRGLYSLMLRNFVDEMPDTDFLIMQSEDLTGNTGESYALILEYMGLRQVPLAEIPIDDTADKRHFLNKDIEYILRQVFEPYNRRLEQLLGKQWAGVWA
jgi:hypothetical protein